MFKNSRNRKTTSTILLIRVAVGAYLLYLTYSFKDSLMIPFTMENAVIEIAAIVFGVAGVFLITFGVKDLIKGNYDNSTDEEVEDKTDLDDVK